MKSLINIEQAQKLFQSLCENHTQVLSLNQILEQERHVLRPDHPQGTSEGLNAIRVASLAAFR